MSFHMFYQHQAHSALARTGVKLAFNIGILSLSILGASTIPALCQDYGDTRNFELIYRLRSQNGPACTYSSGKVFTSCKIAEAHFEKAGVERALSMSTQNCKAAFWGMNKNSTFTRLETGCGTFVSVASRKKIARNGRKYLELHFPDQVE